jgi:hypothetical protein
VVDIIDISLRVDKLDKVLDDGDHILTGENTSLDRSREVELLVDTIASYLAEVIALIAEEEVLDNFASRSIISRLSIAELAIDVDDSLLLGVGWVLLKRVVDDGIIIKLGILTLEEYGLSAALENLLDILVVENSLTLYEDLITLDGYNFSGILVSEVLYPRLEDTCSKLASLGLEHGLLVYLDSLCEVEDLKDVLVTLVTNGTKQGGYWQFLLAVDVGIHDIVDVSSELDPRTLEWDDTG